MQQTSPNMAKLFVSLSFLLLIHASCLAYQPSFQQQNQCQIQRLNALEPIERVQSRGRFHEFFNSNEQEFQCAGVEVIRHQIQPQGLLLPSYTNTPILFYVEQGSGIQGVMLPGCPETYEVSTEQFEGRKGGGAFYRSPPEDPPVPTRRCRWPYLLELHIGFTTMDKMSLLLLPYLTAQTMLTSLIQTTEFFLAGNSQGEQQQQQQQQQFQPRSWQRRQQGESQQEGWDNILRGFTTETLAEAFNVDHETAELLRGENDQRGHIIFVQNGLQVIQPPMRREEQEYRRGPRANGVEETICSMKLQMNIDDPSNADLYNPQAGRCTHLNSFKFPILQFLQLSAERGVLHRYGIVSPHWIMNAHNIIYVTEGNMRIQIVNDLGSRGVQRRGPRATAGGGGHRISRW
ncbi:putative 11-S seed storage protein, plant [Helianthus annuus]|nr:putative 11-S seed storage protein, plant [Helianthus annuus]